MPRVLESPAAPILSHNGVQSPWDFWTCLESQMASPTWIQPGQTSWSGELWSFQPGWKPEVDAVEEESTRHLLSDQRIWWDPWVHSLLSFRQGSLLSVDITPGVPLEPKKNTPIFFFLGTIYKSILRTPTTSRMHGEQYNVNRDYFCVKDDKWFHFL